MIKSSRCKGHYRELAAGESKYVKSIELTYELMVGNLIAFE